MHIATLLALAVATIIASAEPPKPESPWWLVAHVKARRVAIDPADPASQFELPDPEPRGVVSPDGAKVAFQASPDEGGFALYVADVTDQTAHRTKNVRRLTEPGPGIAETRWTAAGDRLIYLVSVEGSSTIHMVEVAADGPAPRQISAPGEHARDPRPAPDGSARVAYRTVSRMAKPYPGELVIVDTRTGDHRALLEDAGISTLEWSPDAAHIACGVDGSLVIIDADDGSKRTLPFSEIDKRFYAHYAPALAWRPDGRAIALRITFAGGVSIDPNAPPTPPPFWAGRVFLVPIGDAGPDAAAATSVRAPDHILGLSWITAADAAAAEPVRPE